MSLISNNPKWSCTQLPKVLKRVLREHTNKSAYITEKKMMPK